MKSLGQRIIAVLIVVLILAQMLTVGISRYSSFKGNSVNSGENSELTIWYTDAKLNDFMLEAAEEYKNETGINVHAQLISAVDYIETISEETFQKENAEIPKVYLDTAETPGREEYVTTTVKIVDGSGQYEEIYDANAGLKVRGHTTAHGEKVPYNIKFEEKKNILGMGESKKWCLIANLFDATLIRNMLALDFARNM